MAMNFLWKQKYLNIGLTYNLHSIFIILQSFSKGLTDLYVVFSCWLSFCTFFIFLKLRVSRLLSVYNAQFKQECHCFVVYCFKLTLRNCPLGFICCNYFYSFFLFERVHAHSLGLSFACCVFFLLFSLAFLYV